MDLPDCSGGAGATSFAQLGNKTYFILRSALDPSLCMEVPQYNGNTSRLVPCNSSADNQRLITKFSCFLPLGVPRGAIASYTRQDFTLCGNGARYFWSTDCGIEIYAKDTSFIFTEDATRIKFYGQTSLGCFVANTSTSTVDYGACNASSPAGCWIIETPGMPAIPAPSLTWTSLTRILDQ